MDNVPNLIDEISRRYPEGVPIESLESYCRRYLHYTIGMFNPNPFGFMGLGDGQKQDVGNFVGHSMLQA